MDPVDQGHLKAKWDKGALFFKKEVILYDSAPQCQNVQLMSFCLFSPVYCICVNINGCYSNVVTYFSQEDCQLQLHKMFSLNSGKVDGLLWIFIKINFFLYITVDLITFSRLMNRKILFLYDSGNKSLQSDPHSIQLFSITEFITIFCLFDSNYSLDSEVFITLYMWTLEFFAHLGVQAMIKSSHKFSSRLRSSLWIGQSRILTNVLHSVPHLILGQIYCLVGNILPGCSFIADCRLFSSSVSMNFATLILPINFTIHSSTEKHSPSAAINKHYGGSDMFLKCAVFVIKFFFFFLFINVVIANFNKSRLLCNCMLVIYYHHSIKAVQLFLRQKSSEWQITFCWAGFIAF